MNLSEAQQWSEYVQAHRAPLHPDATTEEIGDYLICFGSGQRQFEFREMLVSIFGGPLEAACDGGSSFWRWLPAEWCSFDAIDHDEYAGLFECFRDDWTPDCMPAADRAHYDALPEKGIRVYRGQAGDREPGLSWTLDRKVAEGFAIGHRGMRNANPAVLTATVAKWNVAFVCFEARQESEIVLFEAPWKTRRLKVKSV